MPAAVFRLALSASGLALALLAGVRYGALQAEQQAETERLETIGIPLDPRVEREISREPERDGVRLRAARAVLAGEMAHAASLSPETPEERQEMLASSRRLAETARTAGEVLAGRPESWEAAMVLGAATYLSRSLARDSRLFTSAGDWEEPLQAARRMAPAKREPTRFLAAAYLEIWPALSAPKRELTGELVTEMFRDPDDLRLLLPSWLAAVDHRLAFSAIPADPQAWEQAERFYAEHGDWAAFGKARQRWDYTLWKHLHERLAEADARLARGDLRTARTLYLDVAEQARPDARYRDLLAGALSRCPPGPVGAQTAERLTSRLDWAVERCLLAACPLPPVALKRLAHLASDQAPPQEALALLVAGDLHQALLLERRSETLWSEPWAPYLIVKARLMTERRQVGEAQEALGLVHPSWWKRPTYWLARLDFARASGRLGEAAQAEEKLHGFARRDWAATDWTYPQGRTRLELLTESPARGIEVDLDEIPAAGTVVELRLDGASRGMFQAGPQRSLNLAFQLPSGFHVLELDAVGGGRVLPGAVRLR
ncbi:MAG TPA: hypothetical protein VEW48_24690 [Thermoanaerobaculia bacterium]|nr:hypothetical protein [Thermoanaerobaculia bacterium]